MKSAKSVDNILAIGLRAKTARAIAVILGGTIDAPRVIAKTEIRLADPKMPGTAQPYHEVMDLPWEESQRAAQKYIRVIESVAAKELARLIDEQKSTGMKISGVGIVGARDRDLARIGNNHIRAHAAEGVLFRRVLLPGELTRNKRPWLHGWFCIAPYRTATGRERDKSSNLNRASYAERSGLRRKLHR